MWISRTKLWASVAAEAQARGKIAQMEPELLYLRKEVGRLTDVIIQMRQEGFSLGPEHMEDRWPGGRYVMDELEQVPIKPTPAQTEEAARIEAEIRRDLDRITAED
jgi:hypothetical protein